MISISKKVKNIICFLLVFGLILPNFSFSQTQPIQPPENLEDSDPPTTLPQAGPSAKEMGKRTFETAQKELPGILEKIWNEEVLPVWKKIYDWFKENIWSRIVPGAKEEIEKRKPVIEEEFKKEKEELKEELPGVTKSLWERFKELIK